MNELVKRIISGVILFVFATTMIRLQGSYVIILITLVGLLGVYEWWSLSEKVFSAPKRVLTVLFGCTYIILGCLGFYLCGAKLTDGWLVQIFLITLVTVNDAGAYLVGKFFGKHKLCPAISPNKTWEGALGGFIASLITGASFALGILGSTLPVALLFSYIVLTGIFSIIGQFGDLLESWTKRKFGVKDAGRLIPGHGGVLDRIDSLLAITFILAPYLLTL
jgi:phosphatidate cytidylyltransferase